MNGNMINGKKVTEELLIKEGYRKYRGEEVDVYYNAKTCVHAGNCVRENAAIYDIERRPWIVADNADCSENVRVVNCCPSGALKYIQKKEQ